MGHPDEPEATLKRVRLSGTRTSSGNSSWRAAYLLQTDAEYMTAADQSSKVYKPLPRRSQPYTGSDRGCSVADHPDNNCLRT